MEYPSRSPSPVRELTDRIEGDVDLKTLYEEWTGENAEEIWAWIEARASAEVLVALGDIPDADLKAPKNVLFVC